MTLRRLWIISLLTVVIGGLIVTQQVASRNDVVKPRPFTMVSVERQLGEDGKLGMAIMTYEVAADGTWVATRQGRDNKIERITQGPHYQVTTRDNIDSPRKEFPEKAATDLNTLFRTESFLRNHREFARTENVCGLVGYVLSASIPNRVLVSERTFTTETGHLAVRLHNKLANGIEYWMDPISITFQ